MKSLWERQGPPGDRADTEWDELNGATELLTAEPLPAQRHGGGLLQLWNTHTCYTHTCYTHTPVTHTHLLHTALCTQQAPQVLSVIVVVPSGPSPAPPQPLPSPSLGLRHR